MVSLEVYWRIRSSTSSIKILDDKTEGELVFEKGSDFPTWLIVATTGEHGEKITKKSNKLKFIKVKTISPTIMVS